MSAMALVEKSSARAIPCCKARCKMPAGKGEGESVGVEGKGNRISSKEGGAFCKAR
jgi:hypothetical protein